MAKRPCAECPFSKDIGRWTDTKDTPEDALGGSSPLVYIGQANGPFMLPCHRTYTNRAEAIDPTHASPCVGASIYRANIGKAGLGGSEVLPPDRDAVFGSPAEFLAHHAGCPPEAARAFTAQRTVDELTRLEMVKALQRSQDRGDVSFVAVEKK